MNVKMKLILLLEFGSYAALLICVSLWHQISICAGHGRLIEPPSRASAWRYGFQTPPDYNDHELYCGGFTRQWRKNDGKCGECGDPWDVPQPRPHEHGGLWGTGVIVRRYNPGSDIQIRVELTASHMGYFEFRVCEKARAYQDCLDKHLLRILGGNPVVPTPMDLETRFYPRNGSRIYEIKAQLPPELQCNHCVLQWRYIAGNNWGICPNGNGAVGCGPQEEFRACADIALTDNLQPTPMRPLRPTSRTTLRPIIAHTSTSSTVAPQLDEPQTLQYTTFLVGTLLILLFFVVCLGVYYAHRTNSARFKKLNAWLLRNFNNRFCKKYKTTTTTNTNVIASKTVATSSITVAANNGEKTLPVIGNGLTLSPALPIAPPRSKRLARPKDLSSQEFSVS